MEVSVHPGPCMPAHVITGGTVLIKGERQGAVLSAEHHRHWRELLERGMGMARFYFNIRGGEADVRDDFGRSLPDLESARREAVQVVRIIAQAR
jgi:hypothetical protein